MVVFDAVGLRYGGGPAIFRDVSLALTPGSFHFLVGPSGAGKSSLLRLMYLAVRPGEGRMTLFGRQVARLTRRELPAMRRRIGVVFQDFRLLDHLSAFDNVEPTGNVDDTIAVRLMYLFEELNKLGTTVVIATHNESLVERFDHPQIRIAEGRVGLVERAG